MKRFSLFFSYVFCIVGFLFVAALCVALPVLGFRRVATVPTAENNAWIVYLLSYLILALVFAADLCLFLLLESIRKDKFFTQRSVNLLFTISYASILAGILSVPLFFLFIREALFLAFVALFLGAVLRVVGEVIRKANEMKEENDATI